MLYVTVFLSTTCLLRHSYVVRCYKYDDFGKVVLDFQLEVCHLVGRPSLPSAGGDAEVYGVRHKRLKGDAFVYKRVCEDILKEIETTM